jgi:S1-C subfamily serine protease
MEKNHIGSNEANKINSGGFGLSLKYEIGNKVKRNCVIALSLFAIYCPPRALAQGPTKPRRPTKQSIASIRANSPSQLPFGDARNMTVILVFVPDGGSPMPIGSGVWLGKQGYVATCEHVLGGLPGPFKVGLASDPYAAAEGSINISVTGSVDLIEADVIVSDRETDVAILKAREKPERIHPAPTVAFLGLAPPPGPMTAQNPIAPKGGTLRTEFPGLGEILLLAGFPLSGNTLVLQTGVATGFLSRPRTPQSLPATGLRMMLSLVSNPGNSGGPVFDKGGKVVALLEGNLTSPVRDEKGRQVFSPRVKFDDQGRVVVDANGQQQFEIAPLEQNSGISFAVPARSIAELAKKQRISLD